MAPSSSNPKTSAPTTPRTPARLATIYDVAQKSNVSIATVSRVLNKKMNVVSEKTRLQVLKAIQELHFKPNPSARRLVNHRTNLIEIFFHIHQFPIDFKSDWYNDILIGATRVIQDQNLGLLINFIVGIPHPEEIVERVFQNHVDGVLMISPNLEEKHLLELIHHPTPIVLVGHRAQSPRISFVDTHNIEASEKMVQHLITLGHKKIACLAGPIHHFQNARDRLLGFQRAMKQHGLRVPSRFILSSNLFTQTEGFNAMKQLLHFPERPTAVFCADDMLALGAWDAIVAAGLKVGQDISLTGYDDVLAASLPPYSLTTVRQDVQELSASATRLLIEQMKNPQTYQPTHQFQPTQIVLRSSTAPVPSAS